MNNPFSRRLGIALILLGMAAPLALLKISRGRIPSATLRQNLDSLYVPLRKDTWHPVFEVVKKGEEKNYSQALVVQFEETQLFMEFDSKASIEEVQNAVRTRFPDNKLLPGDPNPGRIRFVGWSGHDASRLPFRYILAAGALLVLAGCAFLAFPGQGRKSL